MATTKLVSLADIAQNIETDLNTISASLYSTADIDKEIQFKITADFDHYNRLTTAEASPLLAGSFIVGRDYVIKTTGDTDFTLIGSDNNTPGTIFTATGVGTGTGTAAEISPYTPCIITKATNDIEPDPNIGIYNEDYTLSFQGYQDQYDDVLYIIDTYQISVKGTYITLDGWTILRSADNFNIIGNINTQDGLATKRFQGFGDISWGFIDGGVHSSQVTFKLDDVIIPYDGVRWNKNFIQSNTITADDTTQTSESINLSQDSSMVITIPEQTSNIATMSLLEQIAKNIAANITKVYTFNYTGPVYNETFDVVAQSCEYSINRGGLGQITVTFKKSKLAKV